MLGDVAGKGVPAALLMAKVSSDARFCVLTESDPAAGRHGAQQVALPTRAPRTASSRWSPASSTRWAHTVTLASAGHQPPYIYRKADG
jgi:serine phosphatase RsbU (regulator of sigma subunit)